MVFVLITALLQPADTVTGRVVDVSGQPVASAIIEVTDLGRSVTTTDAGEFRIALAPGRYTLAVRRTGFAPAVREIAVPRQPTLEIVLTPSALRLEPVTVTASRQALAAQMSPLPASALSGDELRQAQGVSLAHVVDALPGVRTLSTGAQIGKPVIRGFSGPRVLVLENGSRLEDYSWSDEDGPSVETAFVRRIELIRGPASVLYGSDAVGGVINVIPEQLPDATGGGPGFIRTGFTLSAASNNIEISPGVRVEGARGKLGWRVAAIGRHAGNLHTPAGELDNTGFGAFNGEAVAGWRWRSGSDLSVRIIHYGGEFKLLEANAPPGETGGPERKAGDERLQITGQRPVGAWRLEAKGQLQRHSLIEVADDTTGTESEAFNLLLQTASLDLLAHHAGVTFGISGVGQSNDASGREPIVPDGSILSGAAFALGQWTRKNAAVGDDGLAPARVVALADAADPERDARMMRQQIERRGLQQQVECFRFGAGRVVRHFDQRVPLQLSLRLQPPGSDRTLTRDLEPLIAGFALGPTGFAGRRVRLEQLELAAVMDDADGEVTARPPPPSRHRSE